MNSRAVDIDRYLEIYIASNAVYTRTCQGSTECTRGRVYEPRVVRREHKLAYDQK